MHVDILNPYFHTILFIILLVTTIIITAKKDPKPHEMNRSHTHELKGLAILMVIFSHIGYFLFNDHRFLYPLSVAGGVGVNIFLFLSGFGLTTSGIKSEKPLLKTYYKRLTKIFVPMWIVLIILLIMDKYLLGRSYNSVTILQSFLGFFPDADIDSTINSPLWYFTLILFYYLIFPLVFKRNKPILSIILISIISLIVVNLNLPVTDDVKKLYKLHVIAFPLGMLFAYINKRKLGVRFTKYLLRISPTPEVADFIRYVLIFLLCILFGFTAIQSGVGGNIIAEQLISLVTMISLVIILSLKNFQSNLLIILGIYSYEIYLIQWPLMYRYDLIYKTTPAFLGTFIYIAVFIILGFALNKIVKFILKT